MDYTATFDEPAAATTEVDVSNLEWTIHNDIFAPSEETLAFYRDHSASAIVNKNYASNHFCVYRTLDGPFLNKTSNSGNRVVLAIVVKDRPVSKWPYVRLVVTASKDGVLKALLDPTQALNATHLADHQVAWLMAVLPAAQEVMAKTEKAMLERLHMPFEEAATLALFAARKRVPVEAEERGTKAPVKRAAKSTVDF